MYNYILLTINGREECVGTHDLIQLLDHVAYTALVRGAGVRETAALAHMTPQEVLDVASRHDITPTH